MARVASPTHIDDKKQQIGDASAQPIADAQNERNDRRGDRNQSCELQIDARLFARRALVELNKRQLGRVLIVRPEGGEREHNVEYDAHDASEQRAALQENC